MKKTKYRTLLLVALVQVAPGQTRIDVSRQTRNIDLRSTERTQPAKSGAQLPANCSEAEVFINTDAPAGANVFVCAGANHWVPQAGSVQVKDNGIPVGETQSQDFIPGLGIITSISNDDNAISIRQSGGTAVVQTRADSQSGRTLLCES